MQRMLPQQQTAYIYISPLISDNRTMNFNKSKTNTDLNIFTVFKMYLHK